MQLEKPKQAALLELYHDRRKAYLKRIVKSLPNYLNQFLSTSKIKNSKSQKDTIDFSNKPENIPTHQNQYLIKIKAR